MTYAATAAFIIPADDAQARIRAVVKFITYDIDTVDECERLTVMIEPFTDADVLWVCAEGFTQAGAADQITRVRELLPATFPGYEFTEV